MIKNFRIIFFYFLVVLLSTNEINAQMNPTYIVNIPMRDGKFLAADVYVPSGCTSCPTILIQTPYNKNAFRNGLPMGFLQNLESSPYSWVVVDWRGFYASASATITQPNRGEDGYDAIDWIVSQSWSNGRIGTWGPSALGGVQYSTAKENHPNHTCAVPMVAHPQQSYDGYFYGGVLEKSRLAQLDALGYGLSTTILANTYYSPTWQYSENTTWYPQDIHIPLLQIGGWYDHNIDKMMDWYEATRTSADINARNKQWLLVGPWVHGGTGVAYIGSANQGELTYSNAAYKSDLMALDFFAYYLLDSVNNWESTSPITYYELGKDSWAYSNANTIEIANTEELFLQNNDLINIQTGTGGSSFISDPRNPSPTLGGPTLSTGLSQGPYNQVSLENRSDIISFSTNNLITDISISGRIKLDLFVECDQPDADVAVRLVDVYPDGRNMLINDGIKRMRFRNGFTQADELFMATGQVYNVEVELPFANYTWKTGHQLKVYISGNNSTRWDVNLQNGGTMYVAGDTNIANIQIHHNSQYPSKIVLPCNSLVMGIEEAKNNGEFLLFPNPVNNILTFKTDILINEIEIRDVNGRLILKQFQPNDKIDVSEFKNGIYFIQFKTQNTQFVKKILKN